MIWHISIIGYDICNGWTMSEDARWEIQYIAWTTHSVDITRNINLSRPLYPIPTVHAYV